MAHFADGCVAKMFETSSLKTFQWKVHFYFCKMFACGKYISLIFPIKFTSMCACAYVSAYRQFYKFLFQISITKIELFLKQKNQKMNDERENGFVIILIAHIFCIFF